MVSYLLFLAVVSGIGIWGTIKSKDRVCLWISLTFLCVMACVRDFSVGTDVSIYHNLFNRIARADWLDIFDIVSNAPVYCIVNKLISYFGDYRSLVILEAAVTCYAVGRYTEEFSEQYAISVYCFVTLFFYMHTYNLSRQFFAISFLLLAICSRREKKSLRVVVFSLIALGIHSLSVIALPLIIFSPNNMTDKAYKISIVLSIAAGVVIRFLLVPAITLFATIFPRYQIYLGKNAVHNVFSEKGSGANILLSVFYLCVVILFMLIQSKFFKDVFVEENEKGKLRYLTFAVLMGAVLGIMGGSNRAIARAIYFYQIHAIALIPNLLKTLRGQRNYMRICYLLFLLLLLPMVICLYKNFGEVVPYLTMWK